MMSNVEMILSLVGLFLASGWLGQLIIYKVQRIDKKKDIDPDDIGCLRNGVCALLRNEIVTSHRMYTQMGYCQTYDKQNILSIYQAYHALGGNDIATKMKNDILALPESPLMK